MARDIYRLTRKQGTSAEVSLLLDNSNWRLSHNEVAETLVSQLNKRLSIFQQVTNPFVSAIFVKRTTNN